MTHPAYLAMAALLLSRVLPSTEAPRVTQDDRDWLRESVLRNLCTHYSSRSEVCAIEIDGKPAFRDFMARFRGEVRFGMSERAEEQASSRKAKRALVWVKEVALENATSATVRAGYRTSKGAAGACVLRLTAKCCEWSVTEVVDGPCDDLATVRCRQ